MSVRGRQLAFLTLGFVLLGSALQIAAPYGLGLIIDALGQHDQHALLIGVGVYLGLEVLNNFIGWNRMRIRERMFQENFWYLPMRLTERYLARPLFKLMSEDDEIDGGGVESVRDKVWNIIGSYTFSIFPNYSLALFSVIACTLVHPIAGAVALVYIMIDIAIGSQQNQYIHERVQPIVESFRRWERRLREWWNATSLIKQNGVERRIIMQVREEVQPALREDDKVWRVFFPWAVLGRRTLGQCFAAGLYFTVGYFALRGDIPVADCILMFFSFERIKVVLEDINDQQRDIGYQIASIDKYRTVLMAPIPFHYEQGIPFKAGTISLTFQEVSLSLGQGRERRPILSRVSFSIKPGERIGIVGPSGAGKSQLINLILRGIDPDTGCVLINGEDLRTLSLASFLAYCGIIPQKSDLFEGSLRENILFGTSDEVPQDRYTDERLWRALEKAGLEFGTRLVNGLETKVGYKGMRLSGGQQARLRIADAQFKLADHEASRPRLIIADEPTASLDSLSEVAVLAHLTESLPTGTTVLMIAHRLSTVAHMDRIMFVRPLDQVPTGSPQVTLHPSLRELYESDVLFRQMADAQNFQP